MSTIFSFFGRVIDIFEELGEDIREKIEQFHKPGKGTPNDKLNDCQRAFVKYSANELLKSGERMSTVLMDRIIRDGIEARLWPCDVESGWDFSSYLQNRLKNEKKGFKCKEIQAGSAARIQEYLVEEMNCM